MGLLPVLLAAASLFLQVLAVSETSQEFLLRQQRARSDDGLAPLYGIEDDSLDGTEDDARFPNEYIVVFQPGYTLQEHFESIGMDLSNTTRFEAFSYGYRAKLDNVTLDSHVRLDCGVLLVETNGPIHLIEPVESYRNASVGSDKDTYLAAERHKRYTTEVLQKGAPYGLRMLSGAGKLPTPVENEGEYHYSWGAGEGVNVYVFDSGIRTSHTLFGGRATIFGGGSPQSKSKYTNEINDDLTGHGTHIAGIIGAERYGVAPFANLISVKVMGNGEDISRVQAALADVIAEHRANKARDPNVLQWRFRGSIINMSFSRSKHHEYFQYLLYLAQEAGITVFASAGNSRQDSSQGWYPCSYPETVCVGAVNWNYEFASGYSNYGSAVEYLAPGTNVLSLGIEDDNDLVYHTGTSASSPYAAGVAAVFVHWQGLVNNQAPQYMSWNALDGIISGVPLGTGTRLVNTGIQSPRKSSSEPFRWAGEYPVKNHNVNLFDRDRELNILIPTMDVSSVASGTPLPGVDIASYTTMQTITVSEPTGLHTEAGFSTWDPSIDEPTSSTSAPTQSPTTAPAPGGVAGQQIALASNINPYADPDAWKRLIGYDSSKISVLIADIQNGGEGSQVDMNWKQLINAANSSGKRVIGYVDTGYLGASEDLSRTRLGSHDLADWVAQIENDVDEWYRLYGSGIGGIFFDEGGPDCGPDNMYSDLYAYINAYTKRRYPGAFTVLHTGSNPSQCFENTMDTLLTFTDSYETYTSSYIPLDWTPADPRKIWHIIDSVPASEIGNVISLAGQRGVGLVEVTDDTPDNPYDTLPDDAYMQSFMSSVQGGSAPVADATAAADGPAVEAPGSLEITSYGYSSVNLNWTSSSNAVGYNVYLNGWQVVSLPSSMTRVTVGDLPPGLSDISFAVKAIGGGNVESGSSNSVSVSTLLLPGGKPIINVQADPQDGFTTYTADVLIPYSSLRIYITYSNPSGSCDLQTAPAWPIYYNPSSCYCGVAMVQNGNLYRYNGTITNPRDDLPWAWALVGSVPVTRTGYTYSWVAPMGSSTMDTTSFVIHAQGHGPAANVFSPCPKAGERPDDGIFCALGAKWSWYERREQR